MILTAGHVLPVAVQVTEHDAQPTTQLPRPGLLYHQQLLQVPAESGLQPPPHLLLRIPPHPHQGMLTAKQLEEERGSVLTVVDMVIKK